MKNITKMTAFAALALVFAASCAKETEPAPGKTGRELHFTVTTAANVPVKSYLDNNLDGSYTPKWSKGDAIAVFTQSITASTTKADGILTNQKEDGTTAEFNGVLPAADEGVFKAVSPAGSFVNAFAPDTDGAEFVGVALGDPDNNYVQKPTNETIDPDCDILVSKPVSYASDGTDVVLEDIYFKRIMSVVKINVNGPESLAGEKIKNFTLTSSAATLAGRAKIDVTNAKIDQWTVQRNSIKAEYAAEADMPVLYDADNLFNSVYLVANPTTLATGTTLTFSGETDNYNFSKEVTLASDIIFPESQIAVINLALAETNLTNKVSYTWSKADLADIAGDDEVVIAMNTSDGYYALTSEKGSSSSPTAVSITVSDGELTGTPKAELIWNISNLSGTLTIYPTGQTAKWLYTTNANDGVRVGTGAYKDFSISGNYLKVKTDKTDRYLGIYNKQDWRCYTNTTGNIKGQTLCFFVKGNSKTALESPTNLSVSGTKTVSWDAVNGAASYNVTIGSETYTSETNSYDASAIDDEYYDVAVVAIPSDTDNYKKSAAATLTAAKFGTPTLTTPELKVGAVDETSVAVTWTVDERATEGYICEIYADETKVADDIVTEGSVAFSGLTAETEYVVKVNAVAVEGEKPYAASAVATITLTTNNDGSLEHPYTAAEAITVIDGGTGLTKKYVKGIVKTAPTFNATYSSLTYDIESGDATLNIYSGLDLGNTGFVGADDLKQGDEVVVFGDLKKYNSTYEMDKNNYLISVNGETEIYRGLFVSGQKSAFTISDDFEFGGKVLQVWRGRDDVDVTASATFSGYDMSVAGKQTVTVTAGSETATYEITVKAAGTVTYTLQFGENYNSDKTQNYTSSWTATVNGFTWNLVNWNNNQNKWEYVKAGPKNGTSNAKITTAAAISEAISTIKITIDDVSNGSITSIALKSSVSDSFDAATTIETKSSVAKGEVTFEIASPQENLYYQLDFTLKNTTEKSNGVAQVSKVTYSNE